MESVLPIISFVCGAVCGVLLLYLLQRKLRHSQSDHIDEVIRSHQSQLANMQASSEAQIAALKAHQQAQIEALKESQAQQLQAMQQAHELQSRALKEEFEHERQQAKLQAMQREQDLRRETMAQFKALATDILKEQSGGLRQSNNEQIEAILKPLSENIESFRKAVNDSYVSETASRKSLTDQIERLMKLNETIGMDAKNLTSALRGNSKVQGDWGEMILQTMLENAGLQEGIHYESQATRHSDGSVMRDEQGAMLRPDVIINMPDARRLIVDSKVSVTAYTDICNATDEQSRRAAMARNLESVKRHIDELSAKRYQDTVEGSADHVLMFVPNEGAYIAAIQADADLWQYAYERNVAIVSPTHLFSVMKIISQLWVQDKQNRNTLEIARRGGKLYEKIVGYVSALQEVGVAIRKASDSYDVAFNRLYQGRGNVVKLAQDLKELGAKTSKSLPQSLLDAADESSDLLEK